MIYCSPGFYYDTPGGIPSCLPCIADCIECVNGTECITCNSDKVRLPDLTCADECWDYYYPNYLKHCVFCEATEIFNSGYCKDCVNVVEPGKYCSNCYDNGTSTVKYLSTNKKGYF